MHEFCQLLALVLVQCVRNGDSGQITLLDLIYRL